MAETKELRLLPALVDHALESGRRPGLGDLELPIRSLFDRLDRGDRNLLDLKLRRRLYRRLEGSSSFRLLELKIAVLRASERVGDEEAINYARRLTKNKWVSAHHPRLCDAAIHYLGAIAQARGQTGADSLINASSNREPKPGAMDTLRESTRLGRPYLLLFQVMIVILLIGASWYFGAARRERMIRQRATLAASVRRGVVNSPTAPVR